MIIIRLRKVIGEKQHEKKHYRINYHQYNPFWLFRYTTEDIQNSTKEIKNQEAVKVDDSTKEKQKEDIKEVERQILEKFNQQQYREGINIARKYKKDNVLTEDDFNAISKYLKYKLNESNDKYHVVESLITIEDDYAGLFSNEIKDLKVKLKSGIDEKLAEKAYLDNAPML